MGADPCKIQEEQQHRGEHEQFQQEIGDVFKIDRAGEAEDHAGHDPAQRCNRKQLKLRIIQLTCGIVITKKEEEHAAEHCEQHFKDQGKAAGFDEVKKQACILLHHKRVALRENIQEVFRLRNGIHHQRNSEKKRYDAKADIFPFPQPHRHISAQIGDCHQHNREHGEQNIQRGNCGAVAGIKAGFRLDQPHQLIGAQRQNSHQPRGENTKNSHHRDGFETPFELELHKSITPAF